MCIDPPEDQQCTLRPETENDCCPQFDCEEGEKPCIDSEGNKHAHGDTWDQGTCEQCLCDYGDSACMSPMCLDPPEDQHCTLRPGTENECCPQFDCEEVDKPCIDSEGNKHVNGEEWFEGRCKHCLCHNGDSACMSPMCLDPPEDQHCTLRLGTENQCCPQFDCVEVNKPCIDRDGKKHAHRDEWDQGKCEHCRCDNGDSDCTSPRCLDLPLGKQCTLQPGTEHDCCPYFDCEEVDKPCTDSDGNKHAHGEEWDQGKCEHCRCENGFSACTSPMCLDPPEDQHCRLRPGTEIECCPQFDCEEVEKPCIDSEGNKHDDGEEWFEGRCKHCLCHNGESACASSMCLDPPDDKQ
ncbi:cysteine-rich motor neuron 1 protein-like [Asterias rubens]|uniref:cysteine-rich motor neuron 1 protein-like n=1 Tax=Asterias rubens TaxID=7604 RepID=UPI0014556915|nr:cysteine-rich motor neuron 1 protein-like [Asterias rubens]XP_033644482.1 cysteine-rich motor neuron 1 protein-like [Asterias rubens]